MLRARRLMRRALAAAVRPTGILCLNDSTAIGALVEAQAQGLAVPRDVAIGAARKTVAAELSPMSLTTADVPSGEAAEQLLDVVFARIEGRETPATVEPEPWLIAGASTGEGGMED
jgi:LacI family transcriptional regulator